MLFPWKRTNTAISHLLLVTCVPGRMCSERCSSSVFSTCIAKLSRALKAGLHSSKDKHTNELNLVSFAVYWLAGAEVCFTVCGALFLIPFVLLGSIKQQTKEE